MAPRKTLELEVLSTLSTPHAPAELVQKVKGEEAKVRATMWDLLDQGQLKLTTDWKVVRTDAEQQT